MAETLTARPSLEALNASTLPAFVQALGGIFEHSPWVAERAWEARPFATVAQLHAAMVAAVEDANRDARLALIRAHPELAGKEAAAGTLTSDSRNEQAGAGLDRCSADELARLRALNRRYREAHGFPFVIAVRGRTRDDILRALEERAGNPTQQEFDRCLAEIAAIGRIRLDSLFNGH